MWQSRSIAKKIYISIGIIVLGYTASMVFVIVEGEWAQAHLSTVSSALFPASQQSQAVLTAFDLQTKAYEEAVTVGDKKLLAVAKEKGDEAVKFLEGVGKLGGLGPGDLKEVQTTVEKLKAYSAGAQALYPDMASGNMTRMDKAAELARESEELKGKLIGLTQC